MTWKLSGFADEISPELDLQLATLQLESISFLELRSVWGTNVTQLSDGQLGILEAALRSAGVSVSAIGSPIGKVPVSAPLAPEAERLRRVIDVAHRFGAQLVRVFSFFIPEGRRPDEYRDEVVDRMGALAAVAAAAGVTLAHENEKNIYGDVPSRCAELLKSVSSPALRSTFDAANFVQCGVRPHTEAYPVLRPYLVYLQVKDAVAATGQVVPAGEGDGEVRQTLEALRDSGFDGFVSLEPHLAGAHAFGGFSGPEAFRAAAAALKKLLTDIGVAWE